MFSLYKNMGVTATTIWGSVNPEDKSVIAAIDGTTQNGGSRQPLSTTTINRSHDLSDQWEP